MGRVWVAEHIALAREVAIKVISEEVLGSPVTRELFEREARATAAVDSPHVVRVLDFDVTDDGFPFLVLERLIGETLADRVERAGALTLAETARLVDQIGHAVSAAHTCGILHRDIKAENIFLVQTKDGSIDARLLDFGVAISKNARPLVAGPVGTPQYMSPEQLMASGVDERSDLFSLAVCVYFALTARLPFDGASLGEVAAALTRPCPGVTEIRFELPRSLDAWFARALARERSSRFATVDEMRNAFEAAVEPPSLERFTPFAHSVTVDERELVAAGVPRRHGVLSWMTVGLLLVGAVMGATHRTWVKSEADSVQAFVRGVAPVQVADEMPPIDHIDHVATLGTFPRLRTTPDYANADAGLLDRHPAPIATPKAKPRALPPPQPETTIVAPDSTVDAPTPIQDDTQAFGARE